MSPPDPTGRAAAGVTVLYGDPVAVELSLGMPARLEKLLVATRRRARKT